MNHRMAKKFWTEKKYFGAKRDRKEPTFASGAQRTEIFDHVSVVFKAFLKFSSTRKKAPRPLPSRSASEEGQALHVFQGAGAEMPSGLWRSVPVIAPWLFFGGGFIEGW